jgi:hypothetical protein
MGATLDLHANEDFIFERYHVDLSASAPVAALEHGVALAGEVLGCPILLLRA